MKVEISVQELAEVFNEIQTQPERIFEMMRLEIRDSIGGYLSELMKVEVSGKEAIRTGGSRGESSKWHLSSSIHTERDWRGGSQDSEGSPG